MYGRLFKKYLASDTEIECMSCATRPHTTGLLQPKIAINENSLLAQPHAT